jgi:hypothetical protein
MIHVQVVVRMPSVVMVNVHVPLIIQRAIHTPMVVSLSVLIIWIAIQRNHACEINA